MYTLAVRLSGRELVDQLLTSVKGSVGVDDLRVVFQPIVDIFDVGVRGYEALVRGPLESHLRDPSMLF